MTNAMEDAVYALLDIVEQTRKERDALQAKLDTVANWLTLMQTFGEGIQTWRLDELAEILGGNHD